MRKLLVILLLLARAALAEEQEFAFALPEMEGRISLGVFDAKGKLVRTLFAEAEEKDFKAGLNGLVAKWDGKDDAGKDAPPGKYQVDGFVAGYDLKAEGVAYHFNDWIEGDDSPAVRAVAAVLPQAGEAFLVYGEADGAFLWNYDEASGLHPLVGPLPPGSLFLAAGDTHLVVQDAKEGRAVLYSLADPARPLRAEPAVFSSGAFWRDRLYLNGGDGLQEWDPQTMTAKGRVETPAAFSALDANAAALIGGNATGVWLRRGQTFAAAAPAELPEHFSLAAGPGETYWLAGGRAPDLVVRQHGFDGELLRELKLTEENATAIRVFASRDSLNFYVQIFYGAQRQAIRGYRPGPDSGRWETFLEKSIEDCRSFGWEKDHLVADAGEAPQKNAFKLTLPPTTLKSQAETLTVAGGAAADGLWLKTASGLPLFRLTANPSFQRVILVPGDKPDTLRLFAGNGAVVAEYLLTGLDNVAPIEAGEVEIPPAKSSP